MAYDSSFAAEAALGIRVPYRPGCKITGVRSRGLAEDTFLAEAVIPPASPRQTAAQRADYEARFPNANRLK